MVRQTRNLLLRTMRENGHETRHLAREETTVPTDPRALLFRRKTVQSLSLLGRVRNRRRARNPRKVRTDPSGHNQTAKASTGVHTDMKNKIICIFSMAVIGGLVFGNWIYEWWTLFQ
jgi:hypothetical protein